MCAPEWQLVRLTSQSVGARLPDGTIVDLQAAHVRFHGAPSPHLRDAVAFRLAASYGADLARDLIAAARRAS